MPSNASTRPESTASGKGRVIERVLHRAGLMAPPSAPDASDEVAGVDQIALEGEREDLGLPHHPLPVEALHDLIDRALGGVEVLSV
jgi:hypothetical protein